MKYLIILWTDALRLWFFLPAKNLTRTTGWAYAGFPFLMFTILNIAWAFEVKYQYPPLVILSLTLIETLVYGVLPRWLGIRLALVGSMSCVISVVLTSADLTLPFTLSAWQWLAICVVLLRGNPLKFQ